MTPAPSFQPKAPRYRQPTRSPSVGTSPSPSGYARRSVSSSRSKSTTRRFLLPHPTSSSSKSRKPSSPPRPEDIRSCSGGTPESVAGEEPGPGGRACEPPPRGTLRARLDRVLSPQAQNRRYRRVMAKLPGEVKHFLGWRDEGVSTGAGRAWLGVLNHVSSTVEGYLLAFVASLIGICSLLLLFQKTSFLQNPDYQGDEKVLLVGSLGATVVLLFSLPSAAPSQPRPVLLGQLVASIIGCSVCKLFLLAGPARDNIIFPDSEGDMSHGPGSVVWIAGGLATALAMAAMKATGSVHPPAGATALLSCTLTGVARLGFRLVPLVVLSSAWLLVIALILVNLTRLRYPLYWWTAPNPTPAPLLPMTASTRSSPTLRPEEVSEKQRTTPSAPFKPPRGLAGGTGRREREDGGDWTDDDTDAREEIGTGELEIMDRIGEEESISQRRGRTRTVER